jgi:hypothetical protein
MGLHPRLGRGDAASGLLYSGRRFEGTAQQREVVINGRRVSSGDWATVALRARRARRQSEFGEFGDDPNTATLEKFDIGCEPFEFACVQPMNCYDFFQDRK